MANPFGNDNSFAVVSDVRPVGDTISISFSDITPGTAGYLGAMEITAVPEPGSVAMLGLAGLALLAWRRARR